MQRFTTTERFLSLFTYLRPGEGRSAVLLCLQSFALMLSYYLLKVIREPMILAEGSAELKAYSTGVQAVLLLFIVPLFAHAYRLVETREGKYHLLHNTLLFFLFNLVAFGLAYRAGWPVGTVFYIWLGIFSVMILALFWAFAADLFNLKSGQRIFPLIAAASALGALLGSGLASRLDRALDHDGVMYCAALLLLVPLWLSRGVEHRIPADSRAFDIEPPGGKPYPLLEGFRIVQRNRYLTLIAVFVVLLNLINTNGQYILTSLVEDSARAAPGLALTDSDEDAISHFWSRYYFLTNLIGFLVQLLLVSRVYKYLGIRGALYILPILMIANYSLIALFPLLVVARVTMMAEDSVNNSLQSTTRHALFLPVKREEKYVGKHAIDTFFFRLGDVLHAALVGVAGNLLSLGMAGFVAVNIGLSLGLLAPVAGHRCTPRPGGDGEPEQYAPGGGSSPGGPVHPLRGGLQPATGRRHLRRPRRGGCPALPGLCRALGPASCLGQVRRPQSQLPLLPAAGQQGQPDHPGGGQGFRRPGGRGEFYPELRRLRGGLFLVLPETPTRVAGGNHTQTTSRTRVTRLR